jgi:glycyl-radical enzyme activating protein
MSRKAIIFDIQRASLHDGPGIRTAVFFKGCPLDCLWCHNPESQTDSPQLFYFDETCVQCGLCRQTCGNKAHEVIKGTHTIDYNSCERCGRCVEACNSRALKIVGKEMSVAEVMAEVVPDIDFYKRSNGGVTLSGGEPLTQFEFASELLKSCKEFGINTCVDTSGFAASSSFKQLFPYIDMLHFDYKITGSALHKKYTGVTDELILANLELAYHSGTPVILRCPIIPGINDTELHFKAIKRLDEKYPDLKGIELLPYHAMGNSKQTSIGAENPVPSLKTTTTERAEKWLEQLRNLNCEKVRLR